MSEHIGNRLDAYLEGMLDTVAAEQLEQHFARCGNCQRSVMAARKARGLLGWLVPAESPPEPGPGFYLRVEEAIERRLARNWFENLGAALRLRLVYPLVFLGLLVVVWTFTAQHRDPEEGLTAIEYPTTEFAQIAFTTADHDQSEDLVMRNLVALPEGR